jgi:CobQ-like glutamine amidotransferase family enzyme
MRTQSLDTQHLSLTIAWLYPELMSTYGDRGNIIVLTKRCEWRGIKVEIKRISLETPPSTLDTCDLLFMGGAQDTQQEIVNEDLFKYKGKILKEKINDQTPGLFICGAYQFLGNYYKTADGKKLKGLELFPLYTENPGLKVQRLIGNIIIEPTQHLSLNTHHLLVGFENHGGRTYLEDKSMAFAKVIKGFGNDGKDKTEGILFKNAIGSYLHGPILPKNPELADWLIQTALQKKYGREILLDPLDDSLAQTAREVIVKKT